MVKMCKLQCSDIATGHQTLPLVDITTQAGSTYNKKLPLVVLGKSLYHYTGARRAAVTIRDAQPRLSATIIAKTEREFVFFAHNAGALKALPSVVNTSVDISSIHHDFFT